VQRAAVAAVGDGRLGGAGLVERLLGRDGDIAVDPRIDRIDPLEVGLGEFKRRDRPPLDQGGGLGQGQAG
jgi:hypothetical protein